MLRTQDPDRSRLSETLDDPNLAEITVHITNEDDAWSVTWGVRWIVVDARRGKISAVGLFRTDSDKLEPDVMSRVETGGTWSTPEREKLAGALMASLDRSDYYPRPHLIDMLEDIGRALLESCAT